MSSNGNRVLGLANFAQGYFFICFYILKNESTLLCYREQPFRIAINQGLFGEWQPIHNIIIIVCTTAKRARVFQAFCMETRLCLFSENIKKTPYIKIIILQMRKRNNII